MALFPAVYALARRAGVTETRWFRAGFPRAYFLYKRFVEDPFHGLATRRPELFRGGHILDVGANIGYNALLFGRVVSPPWVVYAFEPEAQSFAALERLTAGTKVTAIQAAVGATDGSARLWRNQDHIADHRVVTDSWSAEGDLAPVAMRSLDAFLAELGDPMVAFVKIDVQGYELPVLEGMAATLERCGDMTVAFEHDPEGTRRLGFDPAKVLDLFHRHHLYVLRKSGALERAGAADIEAACRRRGYVDVVAARRSIA